MSERKIQTACFKWADIDYLARALARTIKSARFEPEVIVGIQRGGCVPAVILSHLLGVRAFTTIGMKTTETDDIRSSRQTPVILAGLPLEFVREKRVLLVDDVTNTGATIKTARESIITSGCKEVRTAVLVWDTVDVQDCQADYYGKKVEAWAVFPWEKQIYRSVAQNPL